MDQGGTEADGGGPLNIGQVVANKTSLTALSGKSYNAMAMFSAFRSTCALLTAFAVLVVSATCTTAGCVLPTPHVDAPTTALPECCSSHHALPDRPTQPKDDEPCPLCRTILLIGKVIDYNPHAPAALTLQPVQFSLSFSTVHDHCPASRDVANSWDVQSAHDSPTLFALHCALQN
jgi:hypothetical protein